MKKSRKFIISACIISIVISLQCNQKVLAKLDETVINKMEYSEEYKKWLNLSDDEKEKILKPRVYDVPNVTYVSKNPLLKARMVGASVNSQYNLKDIIPDNVIIKNQQNTQTCWNFASLSSLETNLALADYKSGANTLKVYDFSERHMEYATSRTFANGEINSRGYSREVGSGGNWAIAQSYLTNGLGAIEESEMPFENNENIIDIDKIMNKTVTSRVYDTIEFADYQEQTGNARIQIINQIKEHIQNYGAVYGQIHGNDSNLSTFECYNEETNAKYCSSANQHQADHGVSIIGWDDNYSVENFAELNKPNSNGAWIVRNSWGEENGDNGLIYISYEDVNISKALAGIVKATDTVDYDYIYQYDEYYAFEQLQFSTTKLMLYNIFEKKSNKTEYLTEVSIYAPETYTCRVYVNPKGADTSSDDLKLVNLKSGETETFSAGYHTLEFAKGIEIEGEEFAVVVEIQGERTDTISISLEAKIEENPELEAVKVEKQKCFFSYENDVKNCNWADLGDISQSNSELLDGDSTIKAFTTEILNDGSLKNIEIITPPTKTSYIAGEDFDKTGMVIKANYNSTTNPSEILDPSNYSITNGTNLQKEQTSIIIEYEGKIITQTISVAEKENVEVIEKEETKNSDIKNARCNMKNIKAYDYTDLTKEKFTLIEVEINEIIRNLENDENEYYYYISPNEKAENINDWIKISEEQVNNNKISFVIDSRKIKNYEEVSSETEVFLYIKEIAKKGGNQSICISKPMKFETEGNIEFYLDDEKVEYDEKNSIPEDIAEEEDNTVTEKELPNTGTKMIVVILICLGIFCGVMFINYRKDGKDI